MSQLVATPTRSFLASGALSQYRRVKYDGSFNLEYAGASDVALGVLENDTFVAGESVSVRLSNAQGTRKMVAAGAFARGAVLYAAASGKVDDSGTVIEGRALEASSGDGSIVEVMPLGANTLDAGTVTESGTQTLTNKTLTNPTITGATVRGAQVQTIRTRVTTAQVNAGHTLLTAVSGYKYRLVDVTLIAIGGAASGATTVDILGTQSSSSVKLVAAAVAALTQSAVVKPNSANVTVLADGASFVQNDANTAITIAKTGSSLATATNIDVILSYEITT